MTRDLTYFKRLLNFDNILKRKSLFLFGPRQTGKSTLLRKRYPDAYYVDLLQAAVFRRYKTNIASFQEELDYAIINDLKKIIIIDEIQKIPELLDQVHSQIELNKKLRFILTGSSTRKLKRSGVNMLGGRASKLLFHPITALEYGIENYIKNLNRILLYGTLPAVLTSDDPWADLIDYVDIYLKEEIQQEAIVRALDGFSRFLDKVALTNSQQVNFTVLGNDAQVPPRTVREYYHVLEDTLVGYLLPAFTSTKKRKAMTCAKFYLFDMGITNALLDRKYISSKTHEYGVLLEQLIFKELKAYTDYNGLRNCLYYWRSLTQFEVDFVVKISNSYYGIEVKSAAVYQKKDFKGLNALDEELPLKRKILVCLCEQPALTSERVEVLPLKTFLSLLWQNQLFLP